MEEDGIIDKIGEFVEKGFMGFLENYKEDIEGQTEDERAALQPIYLAQIDTMVVHDKTTIFVNFEHLLDHDDQLATTIKEDLYRYDPFLRKALQRVTRIKHVDYVVGDDITREFYVAFWGLPSVQKLRDLKPDQWVGKLASVSGTVTRTSEVRPELLYGTFQCMECGKIARDVEQQFKYTQPAICAEATCANREKWTLVRQECKFVDWQRVRMQESAEEVPAGSLPRTLDVILRHEIVEQARAGDKVVFTGCVVVVPDVGALRAPGDRTEAVKSSKGDRAGTQTEGGVRGLKALGARDLTYKMCFIASSVQMADLKYGLVNIRADEEDLDAADNQFTQEEKEGIYRMRGQERFMDKLVSSIAPAVFGHRDIKKAILLMLFGGVHKSTPEGIKLRGDINICIVGDPSCAKSQFLKYVAGFLPRAVYTSGKSSSAAGLTASVAKEPETGEFCIEAGALMLADNGICCIDEFDKMDVKDQVAIHEAMEQQTISIAKAGIQASLNARTSILAAANPAGGRYDKSKPLKYNVNLPPAILSRFDLVHVMIDEADENADAAIARHIVRVHQYRDAAIEPDFSTLDLQRYIKYARTMKPRITEEAAKCLQETYVQLRRGDAAPGSRVAYRITVRQLEAMVRLSEALARSQLSHTITKRHVDEAGRLLSTSIVHVDAADVQIDDDLFEEEEELRGGPGGDDDNNDDDDDNDDVGRRAPPPESDGPASPPASANGGAPSGNGFTPSGDGTPASDGRATRSASKRKREDQPSPVKSEPADAPADVTPLAAAAGTPVKREPEDANVKPDVKPGEARQAKKAKRGPVPVVSVSQDKIDAVTNMLVYRLRLQEKEAGDGTDAVGMKQKDLLSWYLTEQNEKNAYPTVAELHKDVRTVKLIIQHLIRREGTLVELEDGKAAVEESKAALTAWEEARDAAEKEGKDSQDLPAKPELLIAADERVLMVNPNYALE